MSLLRIIAAVGFVVVGTTDSWANVPSYCAEAVAYRDTQLVQDFDKALKQHNKLIGPIELYEKIRREGVSNEKLDTLEYQQAFDLIRLPFQTLYDTMIAVLPPNYIVNQITKVGTKRANSLAEALRKAESWEKAYNIISGDIAVEVAKITFVAKTGYFGSALFGSLDAIENLLENSARVGEWAPTIDHFKHQLDSLDESLTRLKANLEDADQKIDSINRIREAIDAACGGASPNSPVMSLKDIMNGMFTSSNSTSNIGQALRFRDGYADYCVWDTDVSLSEPGDGNLTIPVARGIGFHERVARIEDDGLTLRFRSGPYVFSGTRYQLQPTPDGFALYLGGETAGSFDIKPSWNDATLGAAGCVG